MGLTKSYFILISTLLSLLICGCTTQSTYRSTHPETMASSGSIVVAYPMPAVNHEVSETMLGFMPLEKRDKLLVPQKSIPSGTWLSINRTGHSVRLMNGEKVVDASSGEGLDTIKPGSYSLVLKQRNPLWYAPDGYFLARALPVPPQGDKSRFRRGALGEFTLFLGKELPIHSGLLWLEEIGGIRLEDSIISKLYYSLAVGAPVEVQ